jgi:hypothetical protein
MKDPNQRGRNPLLDTGPLSAPIHFRIDPDVLVYAERRAREHHGDNLSRALREILAAGVALLSVEQA